MTAAEEVEALVDAAIAERRKDCWCGGYRKPCEHHMGTEEGADMALRIIYAAPAEVVASWLDGA